MNSPLVFSGHFRTLPRTSRRLLAVFLLVGVNVMPAVADDNWTGQGGDSNFSTSANWSNGVPSNAYGVLYFNDQNNSKTTITDDIGSIAQNGLRWYDDQSWTVNTSAPVNLINLTITPAGRRKSKTSARAR